MKNAKLYLLWMQSSAAAPQAGHQIWCRLASNGRWQSASGADFGGLPWLLCNCSISSGQFSIVENEKELASGADLAIFESKEEGHQHSPMAFIPIN